MSFEGSSQASETETVDVYDGAIMQHSMSEVCANFKVLLGSLTFSYFSGKAALDL